MIKEIINFLDIYHQSKIAKYISKCNIDKIIDVGAHEGEFLNYNLKNKKVKKLFAFEPQKKIFNILKKKTVKNNKVKFINAALSSRNGYKKIFINKLTSTSTLAKLKKDSLFLKIKKIIFLSKNLITQTYIVKTYSIDNFFKNKNLKKTLLKIDTEGHEYQVLLGAKTKLKSINFLLIENHFFDMYAGRNKKKIYKFLKSYKFKKMKKFTFPLPYFQDILFKKED